MKNIDKEELMDAEDSLGVEMISVPEDISDFHSYYNHIDTLSTFDMAMRVTEQKLENIEGIYKSLYRPSVSHPDSAISEFISKIDFWLSEDNSKKHKNFQKIAITLYVQLLVVKQKYYPMKSINRRLHTYKLKASQNIEFLNGSLIEKDLKIQELLDENNELKSTIASQNLEMNKMRVRLQWRL